MSLTFGLICAGVGIGLAGGFASIMAWLQPSKFATEIEQSIRCEPKRWKHDYDFTRDDKLALRIKSGRGGLFVKEPKNVGISFADRRLIWKAFIDHKANMSVSDFMGAGK